MAPTFYRVSRFHIINYGQCSPQWRLMNILGKRELIRPSAIQTPETGKRFRNIDYNSLFIGKDIVIVLNPAGLMRIMRIYQIIAFS